MQRSTDNGRSYISINSQQAKGNNSGDYIDNSPAQGSNLYRLKMVDVNNQYTYSDVKAVTINFSNKPIVLYPNPTSRNVNISGLKGGQIIQLYNTSGQLLVQQKAVNTQQQLDLTNYANGTYTIIVLDNKQCLLVSKIVKNK